VKHTLAFVTALLLLAAGSLTTHAANLTFGTGGNQFSIDFVEIGNANTADDTTGAPNPAGKVEYEFRIGKHEISRDMITKANAEGALGITLADLTAYGGNGADRPATGISWFEAATFVNWLNTSQGFNAAYKFDTVGGTFALWESGDAGYDASNPYRNTSAAYYLPSMDEWYKAAYYDPDLNGGLGGYFDYATGSDTAPTAVAGGTTAGTAVYQGQAGPADITNAGGLGPYGTMAQSGNVWEWEETAVDLVNDTTGENRGRRGGPWTNNGPNLTSSARNGVTNPAGGGIHSGFRVAGLLDPRHPVPASPPWGLVALGLGLGLAGVAAARRRSIE
jgi:formylglycine-generating enzyme required for sulfatase activity